MRVVEFVTNLPPLVYSLYSELITSGNGLQVCHEYRYLYAESGYDFAPIIDAYRYNLECCGVSPGLIVSLDDSELHVALINYTLVVHEEFVRRSEP